LLKGSKFKEN